MAPRADCARISAKISATGSGSPRQLTTLTTTACGLDFLIWASSADAGALLTSIAGKWRGA